MAETQQQTEKSKESPKARTPYVPRLRTHFEEVVRKQLSEQFGYTNKMQVPVITKVVLNMGIGEGVNDRKKVDQAAAVRPEPLLGSYKRREVGPAKSVDRLLGVAHDEEVTGGHPDGIPGLRPGRREEGAARVWNVRGAGQPLR